MNKMITHFLPLLLIIEILFRGSGWCGHLHNENSSHHEHHEAVHISNEQTHEHEHGTVPFEHDKNGNDHCNCRCSCMGQILFIPDSPVNDSLNPLYIIRTFNQIYHFKYSPTLDRPPRTS